MNEDNTETLSNNDNLEFNEDEEQRQFLKQKLEEIEREEKEKEKERIKKQQEYQAEFIKYMNNRKKQKVLKQLMNIWLNTNKWKYIGKKLKIYKDDNNDEAFVEDNMEFFRNNINYENIDNADDRVCRICLGGVNDIPLSGKLISPCKCKGSMKYVHINCLNEWRLNSANKSSYYQCDQCKYKYHFQRTKFAKILSNKLTLLFITFIITYLYIFFTGFILKSIIQLKNYKIGTMEFPKISFFNLGKEHHFYGFFVIGIFGALKMTYRYIFDISTLTNNFIRLTRSGNSKNRKDDELTIIILLIIGCIKFMFDEYKNVYKKSKESLTILEERILEVNEDEDEEDDKTK